MFLLTAKSSVAETVASKCGPPRAVAVWLFACCGLIFLMVVVGGITRLTLSGLSITEWNPVIGIVPPLTHAEWAAEFARYRQVPEYQALHYGMSLGDFKSIYFWEYLHRLLGRLIGLVFAGPLVWFWLKGRLPRRLGPALVGILALGFAQGLLGWYMVESGLAGRVEVSQYRLVAHLALALTIYSLILWTGLGLLRNPAGVSRAAGEADRHGRNPVQVQPDIVMAGLVPDIHGSPLPLAQDVDARDKLGHDRFWLRSDTSITTGFRQPDSPGSSPGLTDAGYSPLDRADAGGRRAAEAIVVLVGLTIAAGGFVAGTRAGFVYNTFPLMGGHLVPTEYAQLHPFIRNWFENVAAVQFDHRVLAMTTAAAVLAVWLAGRRAALPKHARVALHALLAAAALQVTLGVSTLLLVVPVPLAAAHQAGAVLLLTAAVVLRHMFRRAPRSTARGA